MTGLIRVEGSGRQLTPLDIVTIEKKLGKNLLPEHEQFLLHHNGGSPIPCYLHVAVADMKSLKLDTFYGLGDDFDIIRANEYAQYHLPRGTIVIAGDDGAGSFLIRISGSNKGEILFLDEESGNRKPYVVASSFGEMLRMLRPDPIV